MKILFVILFATFGAASFSQNYTDSLFNLMEASKADVKLCNLPDDGEYTYTYFGNQKEVVKAINELLKETKATGAMRVPLSVKISCDGILFPEIQQPKEADYYLPLIDLYHFLRGKKVVVPVQSGKSVNGQITILFSSSRDAAYTAR